MVFSFHQKVSENAFLTREPIATYRCALTDVLAAVVTKEPDLNRAPVKVCKLLRRCLEKDPKRRLRDIGEVRFLLEEGEADTRAQQVRTPPRTTAWAIAAVLLLAFVALAFVHFREKTPQVQPLQSRERFAAVIDELEKR